jgi:hypothetical protein
VYPLFLNTKEDTDVYIYKYKRLYPEDFVFFLRRKMGFRFSRFLSTERIYLAASRVREDQSGSGRTEKDFKVETGGLMKQGQKTFTNVPCRGQTMEQTAFLLRR